MTAGAEFAGVLPMGVSYSPEVPFTCAACEQEFTPELYVIVDASERRDLIDRIKRNILHSVACPRCSVIIAFKMPLLVYRPDEAVQVIYSPTPGVTKAQQEQHEDMLFQAFRERMGEDWRDDLTKHIYLADREEVASLIDLNLDLTPGGHSFDVMREALDKFIFCPTWEESLTAVKTHSILLTREAEFSLEHGIRNLRTAGNQVGAAMSAEHLEVLQESRSRGVEEAFAGKCERSGRTPKGNLLAIYGELARVADQPHKEEAVALARAGLRLLRREENEKVWARLQWTLGDGLLYLARTGRKSETDDAAWHYRSALEYFTRDRSMRDWGMLTWQLLETMKITPSHPTAPQLALSIMCRAERQDRRPEVAQAIWADVWQVMKAGLKAPPLSAAVEALAADGMVRIVDDGAGYDIDSWVVASVSAGLTPRAKTAIDGALASYWLPSPPPLGEAVHDGRVRQRVVAAILSAAPYLARTEEWDFLAIHLRVLVTLDRSRATLAKVREYQHAIYEATGRDALSPLEEVITGVDPRDVIPALNGAFGRLQAAGDFPEALVTGLQLAEALVQGYRVREAYSIAVELSRLAAQAQAGPWATLAIEAQQMRVLLQLDRSGEVLDRALALRERLADPAMQAATDPDGIMSPYEVRENIYYLGVRAANNLGRWRDSLAFSDDLLASKQGRGATPYDLAATQHNRTTALRELGELDAAETILLYCQEIYAQHGSPGELARTCSALAKIAHIRGHDDRAIELQTETLKLAYRDPDPGIVATAHWDLARYLPAQESDVWLAHSLTAALIYRLINDETSFNAALRYISSHRLRPELYAAATRHWIADLAGRLDGVDLAVLEAEMHTDPSAVSVNLQEILAILRTEQPEETLRTDSLARRWEPAIAATVAAVSGDQDATAALSEHLEVRELAADWSHLVDAFRLVINGERDPRILLPGLDATDAAIITRTLDALAGRVELYAQPSELNAVTDYARRMNREYLDVVVDAARGHLGARDRVREWADFIRQRPGHEKLATAVLAAIDGSFDPGSPPDTLTPGQLRIIQEVTRAIAESGQAPDESHTDGNALYLALSDPIGPPYAAVSAVVNNTADLEQSLLAIQDGIGRRLAAGHTAVPLQVLALALTRLLSRDDTRNALPMAEALASIPGYDATVAIRTELIDLVCLTAIRQAASTLPDSFLSIVGPAVPRETPAPLGTLPGADALKQARRWLAAARTLQPLAPGRPWEVNLALADAVASTAFGDVGRAIELARVALDLAADQEANRPGLTATATMVLAGAYSQRGDLRQALDLYDQVLAAPSAITPLRKAEVLIRRGGVHGNLGYPRHELADLNNAAELLGSDGNLQTALMRGVVYNRLGEMHELLGELSAAASAYERGLLLARSAGHKTGEAAMLAALGSLFGKLSTGYLRPLAEDELMATLRIVHRIDPKLPLYLPSREGTRAVGMALLRQAAEVYKAANNKAGWSHAANGLSNLIPDEQSEVALGLLTEILRIREEDGDPLGQAVTLANIAARLYTLDRVEEAEDTLRRSLEISRPAGYFESAVRTAATLGLHQLSRGDRDAAETTLREAVAMIETARPHQLAGDRSRIAFAQHYSGAYEGLVECLLARGANEEAFNVVQQAKSRALLELAATTDLQPADPVSGRFAELLAAETEQLAIIRSGHERPETTGHAQDVLDIVYEEMAAHDAEYVSMRHGTPATVESVRQWLARQQRPVLLAEYFIGLTGLTIFCLRAEWDTVKVYSSEIGAGGLRRGFYDFRRQVVQYRNRAGDGWMALSVQLTEPLRPHLEPDDLIVLVPHGIMHALPLHALPIGGMPLAGRHPVVYTPACGLLPLCQDQGKGTGALATCAAFGITYEEEAEAVAATFGSHPIPAAGLSAETVALHAADHDIAHFSSHAYFDPADPLGSGLYLRPGTADVEPDPADVLTARQIMNMRLRNELVTISGCETGLHAALEGDELLGLTRAFLHAGTPSIIASLWPVDAATTSEFMIRFYHYLRERHTCDGVIDKADALRKAQLDIIKVKGPEATYYWAPFILIGDWT